MNSVISTILSFRNFLKGKLFKNARKDSTMESSFNEIIFPFENEWKFYKADLMDLMDKENRHLRGKLFYAYNIPGLHYYITIYPNGDFEKYCGKTGIFLRMNGSEERKIATEFTISIESANKIKSFNNVYDENTGWGKYFCKTEEFFDSKNKYFVNGEITIKVKGFLKAQRPTTSIISTAISMKWKIKEDNLKEALTNESILCSKKLNVASFSNVKYYLSFYPKQINSKNEENPGLYLIIEMGKEKKIEAVYDFNINTLNYGIEQIFEKTKGWGYLLSSTVDLFDPSKGFIVDGFLTIDLNGILMKENKKCIRLNCKNGVAPKKDFFKLNDKNFTIFVDTEKILVHKQVLKDASPVWAGMLESGMNESVENKMEIKDFEFKIVEAAVKLCYRLNGPRKFTFEEMLLLYKFADKYQIQFIMEMVENYLITQISPANIVHLIKFSSPDSLNVKNLYQNCIKFFIQFSKTSTAIYGSHSLDEKFIKSVFLSTFISVVDTSSKA